VHENDKPSPPDSSASDQAAGDTDELHAK